MLQSSGQPGAFAAQANPGRVRSAFDGFRRDNAIIVYGRLQIGLHVREDAFGIVHVELRVVSLADSELR